MSFHKLLFFTAACFALFACGANFNAESAEKPNVIVILIDDMGWNDLSCFGNEEVKTPRIDKLASEGIAFTQFHVGAPICSPSRCGLLTGQYPYRWKITSFLSNRQHNAERGIENWLDVQAPSIGRLFKDAGYVTGHFGKWHLGGQRDVGEAPQISEYGFDESLTNFEGLGPRVLPLLNTFDGSEPRKYSLGSENLGKPEEITWVDRNKVTSSFVNKSIEFIKKAQKENKPFYINLWPDDMHSPFFPDKSLRGDESKKALYNGVLIEMDRQLAPLLDYVRNDEKLKNNTLIVFFSDNGPEPGAGSSAPLRGNKGMLYEGGTRSSLIVWGPGLQKKNAQGGRNETAVFQSLDILPSLLKIAGISSPADVKFDGEDFSDIMLGNKKDQARKSPIFWRRPPDRPGPQHSPWPDFALKDGQWKFMMQYDGTNPQLYDLSKDVAETENLAEKYPEKVAEYMKAIESWSEPLPKDAGSMFDGPGLKLELDFTKGRRLTDLSGCNNIVKREGTLRFREVDARTVCRFDGNSNIQIDNSRALDCAQTPWSVEVKFRSEKPDGLIMAQGGVANGYALFIENGKPGFGVAINSEPYLARGNEKIEGWTTLKGVITPDKKAELYINGKLVSSVDLPDFILSNPADSTQIGIDKAGQVIGFKLPYFEGDIERIAIRKEKMPK